MTPNELRKKLQSILADETGISICWEEHEAPMSLMEIDRVEDRVRKLLSEEYHKALNAQLDRARAAVRA